MPQQPGRGLTKTGFHFLAALPRLDSFSGTDDLTAATKSAVAEESTRSGPGRGRAGVRMLPTAAAARRASRRRRATCGSALGRDEQRLAPVWHDFGVTPHLLVFGDTETGKTNVLRLILTPSPAATGRTRPGSCWPTPGATCYSLVPEEYRVGSRSTAEASPNSPGRPRCPSASASPARHHPRAAAPARLVDRAAALRAHRRLRAARQGPGMGSPLEPRCRCSPRASTSACTWSSRVAPPAPMRAMMDPVMRRMWELGNPGAAALLPQGGRQVPRRGRTAHGCRPGPARAARADRTARCRALIQTGAGGRRIPTDDEQRKRRTA